MCLIKRKPYEWSTYFVKGAGPVASVVPVIRLHAWAGVRAAEGGPGSRAGAHASSRAPWASSAPAPSRPHSPPHTTGDCNKKASVKRNRDPPSSFMVKSE